jgi:hypothetical protein
MTDAHLAELKHHHEAPQVVLKRRKVGEPTYAQPTSTRRLSRHGYIL